MAGLASQLRLTDFSCIVQQSDEVLANKCTQLGRVKLTIQLIHNSV